MDYVDTIFESGEATEEVNQQPHQVLSLQTTLVDSGAKVNSASTSCVACMSHRLRPPRIPSWTATNQLYQRHPRLLLLLEQCQSLRHLKPVLAAAVVSGLFRNPFVASRIHLAATAVDPALAAAIFARTETPNLFSWNTMIRAYVASADRPSSASFSLYLEMLKRDVLPDKHTFPFLLKACRAASELILGKLVHCHACILGLDSDPYVQAAVLSMYSSCGSSADACQLFEEMSERDVVSWTSMICGLVRQDCFREALEVFNDMRGCGSDVRPNVATMVSVMSACASFGSLDHARGLHAFVEKVGLEGDSFVRNSLIDMYAKCGSITGARQVFSRMGERDVHSWTAMITSLASHGLGREALDLFSEMQEMGFVPDAITFLGVLSACSHARLVDEGIKIFNSMNSLYMITPELKHYGCMVDLFSRAGLLARAYEFVLEMPMEPNLAILGSLLSACRIQKNIELGKLIAKKIELVCQDKGGSSILLSNLYADQQQWYNVVSVREVRRANESKPPGHSWIEVRGVVHEFVVEDRLHLVSKEIQLVLNGLGKLMKLC